LSEVRIALDPSGSKLYTANGASNHVSVVDVKSRKELRRIKVGDGPWGVAIVSAAKQPARWAARRTAPSVNNAKTARA